MIQINKIERKSQAHMKAKIGKKKKRIKRKKKLFKKRIGFFLFLRRKRAFFFFFYKIFADVKKYGSSK